MAVFQAPALFPWRSTPFKAYAFAPPEAAASPEFLEHVREPSNFLKANFQPVPYRIHGIGIFTCTYSIKINHSCR